MFVLVPVVLPPLMFVLSTVPVMLPPLVFSPALLTGQGFSTFLV
jgi:hypothetical protein